MKMKMIVQARAGKKVAVFQSNSLLFISFCNEINQNSYLRKGNLFRLLDR